MMDTTLREILNDIKQKEDLYLSDFATKSSDAFRLKPTEKDETRPPFAHDRDKILYSGAYRRYQGKTQVIYFANVINEEMSNRSLHTIYVSQIARTIGKMLNLNLDLIEAIALGHDLGHTPFGHDGEKFLSELCVQHHVGEFHHNLQGLHIVDHISRQGRGLNLTFQVRDGIVSHDGEVHEQKLEPFRAKTEEDLQSFVQSRKAGKNLAMMPATIEGCVVKISDTIAYIGQDIEDAIRLGLLKRENLPKNVIQKFGNRNSQIIDALVKSVVKTSYGNDYIAFDVETSNILKELKEFNYKNIYHHDKIKHSKEKIRLGFQFMFHRFMNDLQMDNKDSLIFRHFLNGRSQVYWQATNDAEKVRDFLAGMTDRYFTESLKQAVIPGQNFHFS